MKIFGISLAVLATLSFPCALHAQELGSETDEQLREVIEHQIETYTDLLDLEYWQVFYVDSIMTHDYTAMTAELQELSDSKVTNTEAYERVQDKWAEQMYNAYREVFNDQQWQKYLKAGAARDKKARDKREARRQ
ncbi:MAG TPA: hypothetical protein IAC98_03415 [Candidatus Cryptobacteroides pullicola]|nr:hypothetical protein [Candidatus Cryptobacteroides pullicola]